MVLGTLGLLVLAMTRQDTAQLVNYTTRAKPLQSSLADISKQTKVHLVCTSDIAGEPFILRLKQVSLKEMMDKVADAIGGQWTKTEKGYQLALGPVAKQRNEEVTQRAIEAWIAALDSTLEDARSQKPIDQATLESIAKTLSGQGGDTQAAYKIKDSVVEKFILSVLKKIDPRVLCQSKNGEAITFASEPNEFQLPIPEFVEELDAYLPTANALAQMISASTPETNRKTFAEMYPVVHPPFGKVILKTDSNSRLGRITGLGAPRPSLVIYDPAGVQLCSLNANVKGKNFDFRKQRDSEQKFRTTVKKGIKLGRNAEEIAPYVIRAQANDIRPISQETRNLLVSPEETDPLALATSDIVLGLAEQYGVNVVYLPTDLGEVWSYIASRGGEVDLNLYEAVLGRSNDTQLSLDDKWLLGRPTDPLDTLQYRVPRGARQTYLQTISEDGYRSIDALSDFAAATTPEMDVQEVDYAALCLVNAERPCWHSTATWAPYAFYGTLQDVQKRDAANTLRLSRADLSDDQVEIINRWVLSERVLDRQPDILKAPRGEHRTIDEEMSEAVATGLGASGFVEIKDTEELRYFVPGGSISDPNSPMNIADLAWAYASSKHASQNPDIANMDFGTITPKMYRTVRIRVVLQNGYGTSTDLYDTHTIGKPKSLDAIVNEMSPEMKAKYEQALITARAATGESAPPPQPDSKPPQA